MEDVKNRLRQILVHYLKDRSLPTDQADIRAYGIDSVEALELFAEIESEFGIRFSGEELDFSEANSIAEIAQLVVKKLR